jgi:phospholipase A1
VNAWINRPARRWRSGLASVLALLPALAFAQAETGSGGWQACQSLTGDDTAQLACFRNWARAQTAALASDHPSAPVAPALPSTVQAAAVPEAPKITIKLEPGCHNKGYSELSRFWELEDGTDCGNFGIRGYRPISLSAIGADSVNSQPTSPSAGHTGPFTPYRNTETRIQLSVRTRIASGLLPRNTPGALDSLWFGYTQQSYWQIFSGKLSRPFRTTDHEPEVVYVYPTRLNLPGGWTQRLTALGLSHQSNGQPLPLSRSWNRAYLMAAFEKDSRFQLQAKIWQRQLESAASDDNPDISDKIGRAEFSGNWQINPLNRLALTWRTALRSTGNGSVRLEWLKTLGDPATSGLRLHAQLFSGYGDSMIDYNRRRTVLGVGLSLVDW